jgi:hypothetical protein
LFQGRFKSILIEETSVLGTSHSWTRRHCGIRLQPTTSPRANGNGKCWTCWRAASYIQGCIKPLSWIKPSAA